MILKNYPSLGGIHPETASIKNILSFHGVKAPHTGKPFSEAMLLGIGGGLGASYILWEMEKHGYPSLVLAFRNRSNYSVKFLQNLCQRLGATAQVFETGGKKKAAVQLEEVLAGGDPAIVWMDLGGAPYYRHYLEVGVTVVFGLDGDQFLVDSLASKPYAIPAEQMVEVRAKVPSYKNRIMVVQPGSLIELPDATQQGLTDCVEYLSASSTSFSLPTVRKWARMLTNEKHKKGWPTVFKHGRGLYGALRTVYEAIVHIGTGGGGLRGLYAEFLQEAAPVVGQSDLESIAEQYQALHLRWQALAQAALPEAVEGFKNTKDLLDRRAELIEERGSDGLAEIMPINDALHELKGELNPNFPLSASETSALLTDLQSRLTEIYEAEKEALEALKTATGRLV